MTTTVKVKANHGWPVEVTPINRNGQNAGPRQMVPPDAEREFSVHDGAAALIDLLAPIAANRDHPGSRCAAIAMHEVESAAMWAVKAVTKQPKGN